MRLVLTPMNSRQENNLYFIALLMCCIGFVIMKLPVLNLPHFWDEAFPYSFAIGHLTENGPSILPSAVPPLYYTGHPLFYYFIQALWNSWMGETLWIQRLLPLFISMLSGIALFSFGKQVINPMVGLTAVIFLFCQDAWIAQSSFQLPETTVSLLFLLTMLWILEKKRMLFLISSSLLLLTKEPTVVLLFALWLYEWGTKKKPFHLESFISLSKWYVLPVIIGLSFYVIQYFTYGWFLFPRHTGFMQGDLGFFSNQLSRYFEHLFLRSGRNVAFFVLLIGAIWIFFRRRKENIRWPNTLFIFLPLGLFLLFSAFNFYSNRYILVLHPLFALALSLVLYEVSQKRHLVLFGLVLVLSGITFWEGSKNRKPVDHSIGYADAVMVQQEAVDFCVAQEWQTKRIGCGFIMSKLLTDSSPRYVNNEDVFLSIEREDFPKAEVLIIGNDTPELLTFQEDNKYERLKRFEQHKAWIEVYVLKD